MGFWKKINKQTNKIVTASTKDKPPCEHHTNKDYVQVTCQDLLSEGWTIIFSGEVKQFF